MSVAWRNGPGGLGYEHFDATLRDIDIFRSFSSLFFFFFPLRGCFPGCVEGLDQLKIIDRRRFFFVSVSCFAPFVFFWWVFFCVNFYPR